MGRDIQVRSAASAESVQAVESFVNGKLGEVATSIPHADQQLVALLALLNISEAYLALSGRSGEAASLPDASVERILQKIDKALE
jgi:cell division protein ZapA (FtsZ GTPase activity inhibitor)